jgi:hypothetical protein
VPVYTIHVDRAVPEQVHALERMVLVPEKFNIWAFIFGPFWLMANRLWLAFGAWLVFLGLLALDGFLFGLPAVALSFIHYSVSLLLGLEANDMRRRRLERRGVLQVDVASGRNAEEAERRFLTRQDEMAQQALHPIAAPVPDYFRGNNGTVFAGPSRPASSSQPIGGLFDAGGQG